MGVYLSEGLQKAVVLSSHPQRNYSGSLAHCY